MNHKQYFPFTVRNPFSFLLVEHNYKFLYLPVPLLNSLECSHYTFLHGVTTRRSQKQQKLGVSLVPSTASNITLHFPHLHGTYFTFWPYGNVISMAQTAESKGKTLTLHSRGRGMTEGAGEGQGSHREAAACASSGVCQLWQEPSPASRPQRRARLQHQLHALPAGLSSGHRAVPPCPPQCAPRSTGQGPWGSTTRALQLEPVTSSQGQQGSQELCL